MGRNYLADIPGNCFVAVLGTQAAVGSTGANARSADVSFVAPANLKVLSAWRINQGTAEATNSNASRYRDYKLLNGGTSGTGATVLASVRSGTAVGPAANGTQALTLAATPTVAQGEVIWGSALASAGAASDDSTGLIASVVQIAYELL